MRTIPLTQGRVAIVDDDYERFGSHRWRWLPANKGKGGTGYAVRSATTDGQRRIIYMHREIVAAPPGLLVDHRDFNALNNQRANLRVCTRSESAAHRKGWSGHRYKGVLHRRAGRWEVRVGNQYIGVFPTEEAAACAYDAVARELWGEFAYPNFPL